MPVSLLQPGRVQRGPWRGDRHPDRDGGHVHPSRLGSSSPPPRCCARGRVDLMVVALSGVLAVPYTGNPPYPDRIPPLRPSPLPSPALTPFTSPTLPPP